MNYNNNISPDELETIERYLTGNMTAGEVSVFEIQLQQDVELKNKTEEVRALLTGISEQSLSTRLNDFHSQISSENKPSARIVPMMKKLLMAASILAVAFVAVWWFTARKSGNDDLYANLYSPDPGLATVMGNSSAYDFDKAMVEYKNGEYDKALEAWTALLNKNPKNDTLMYFVGVAYQAKNDSRAVDHLEKVSTDASSAFTRDASWYLGLYYLKTGQKEKALDYIQRSGHPKSAEAIKAINKK